MAKASSAATTAEGAPAKTGPSFIVQIAVLLVLTGAAVGAGWFSGGKLRSESGSAEPAAESPAPAAGGHGAEAEGHGKPEAGKEEDGASKLLVDLAPITTNLAAPSETWIRLEASVVLDKPAEPVVIEAVHQDLVAFLRTLKMHQIEGASGFQHLKADLEERAAIRSGGHVKNVLIRTLLFE